MDNESEELRFVSKRFKCHNCMNKFTKLVRPQDQSALCDNCQNVSFEISEEEFKRKTRADIDQAPRMVFAKSSERQRQEETKTNNSSQNRNQGNNFPTNNQFNYQQGWNQNRGNNFNQTDQGSFAFSQPFSSGNRSRSQFNTANTNSNQRNQQGNVFGVFNNIFSMNPLETITSGIGGFSGFANSRQPIDFRNEFFGGFFPFFSSPFTDNIRHHNFGSDIFDPMFEVFGTSFNNTFRDNYSSNFRSNLFNNDIINIIIQESFRNSQENKRPPVAKEAIERLNKFKMTDKHCKKNEKGELEQPTCSVCLCDINMEEETILIPCGHMFHSQCILKWFDNNNTCPVCRFELPSQRV